MLNDSTCEKLLRLQIKDSHEVMMRLKKNAAHFDVKDFFPHSFIKASFRSFCYSCFKVSTCLKSKFEIGVKKLFNKSPVFITNISFEVLIDLYSKRIEKLEKYFTKLKFHLFEC